MSIKIKQHDITDCGAACIASISAHYKLKLPISRIRQMAGTDKKGTNALGVVKASEKLGFTVKAVRGTNDSLVKIPLPAIAHVVVKEVLQHYVVIYKVDKENVTYMDPGDGEMHKKSISEFEKEWTGVLILMVPNDGFKKGNEKVSNISRFIYLLRPHKRILFQALFGAIIYTILGLSTSIYIQKLTDFVLVDGNVKLLNLLSIIMVALVVIQIFIGATKTIFVLKTGQLIDSRLILGYYKHLLKLPQRFFDTMRTGEIISRINDAVKIRAFINDTSINLLVNLFIVFFSFGLMFIYSWKLALSMALIIPLYALVYVITNKLNKKQERKVMEKAAELESQLVESLNSVKTIKQFGIEEFSNLKTETRFISLLQSGYKSGINSIFSGNSSEFLSRIFTIILLWFGGYLVIDKTITPGELMSFYAIIGYFTGPVAGLIGMNKNIQNALIAADRLFEIMDLDQEEGENTMEISKEHKGDIILKDVSFSYGTRVDVFDKLNLNFPQGKISAIIGESGSGKTTITALIQKLYPLNNGSIFIGDLNTRYLSTESLRAYIGIVPQHLDLFAGNVIENIALGDYEPEMERILEICRSIGILEFIEELPNGFQTYLGENGASLSGGQKQRLAIARALYRNPQVLLLDEATSALDSVSEDEVQNCIQNLRDHGKTIILIAHRLSTVLNADKIVVLEKGKLVEEGSHTSLYHKKGKYYELWQKQMPVFDKIT